MGVPKSTILAPSRFKNLKNEVQEGCAEKALNFDRNFVGKCELLRSRTFKNRLFYNRIVLSAFYEKYRKSDRKMMPKGLPKSIRNRDFAIQDPIFAILGGVFRSPIFDGFLIGKKSAKNLRFGI